VERTLSDDAARALIIVCAGGHAREVSSYVGALQAIGAPVILHGFVDDHRSTPQFEGAPVLGSVADLRTYVEAHPETEFSYITAVGDNRTRQAMVRRIEQLGAPNLLPWTVQHPSAVVGKTVRIGAGTCIAPNTVITSQVEIGEHCILNTRCSISHDSVLGPYVNVNPGATICGAVTVGEGAFIGAGATIINNVRIGAWSVIGAGAVVIGNVPPHVTAVGVPSRIIRHHAQANLTPSLVG
jgi:acetyltransferase EpsM